MRNENQLISEKGELVMSKYENIIVEVVEKNLGFITINRPKKLNAISGATRDEIGAAINEFEANDEVKIIILTGAGGNFSAGQDLNEAHAMSEEESKAWIDAWEKFDDFIQYCKKPTLSMIEGYAIGGGFQTALYCDFRVAALDAKFSLREVQNGIPCIAGTFMIASQVGLGRVAPLTLMGQFLSGEKAEQIGIVHWAFPASELREKTIGIAKEIASLPTVAVSVIREWKNKELMNRCFGYSIREMRERCKYYHSQAFATGQPQETMDAFLKKSEKK